MSLESEYIKLRTQRQNGTSQVNTQQTNTTGSNTLPVADNSQTQGTSLESMYKQLKTQKANASTSQELTQEGFSFNVENLRAMDPEAFFKETKSLSERIAAKEAELKDLEERISTSAKNWQGSDSEASTSKYQILLRNTAITELKEMQEQYQQGYQEYEQMISQYNGYVEAYDQLKGNYRRQTEIENEMEQIQTQIDQAQGATAQELTEIATKFQQYENQYEALQNGLSTGFVPSNIPYEKGTTQYWQEYQRQERAYNNEILQKYEEYKNLYGSVEALNERITALGKNGQSATDPALEKKLDALQKQLKTLQKEHAWSEYEDTSKWFKKYQGATFDEIGEILMNDPTVSYEERRWALDYGNSVKTGEDYDKQIAYYTEQATELEQLRSEYDQLKKIVKTYPTQSQESQAATTRMAEISGKIQQIGNPQEQIDQLEYEKTFATKYAPMVENEDFDLKSTYKAEPTGKSPGAGEVVSNVYFDKNSGWEYPLYEAINGNEEAASWLTEQAAALAGGNSQDGNLAAIFGRINNSKSELKQMEPGEIAIFNYIYHTQGRAAAQEYYDFMQPDLLSRQRQAQEAAATAYAKEHPVLSSIGSVVASPAKVLSYVGQLTDYLGDGEVDKNAAYNSFIYESNATRQAVAQKIQESGEWGEVGSYLYEQGMSLGDFLFTTAITGGNSALSLAIMGTSAAADTTLDALDRGLSSNQAMLLGTISGATEILTEKISIDALLDRTGMGKTALGYILQNMLAEGSEEGVSGIANILADILISKDKSEWNMSIQAYKDAGYGENKAFWKAMGDQALSIGLDVLGGSLSGAAMGSGSAAISAGGAAIQGTNLTSTNGPELIAAGLNGEKNGRAYYLATQMQAKLDAGEQLSSFDLGRMFKANQAEGLAMELTPGVQAEAEGETSSPQGEGLGEDGSFVNTQDDTGVDGGARQPATIQEAIRQQIPGQMDDNKNTAKLGGASVSTKQDLQISPLQAEIERQWRGDQPQMTMNGGSQNGNFKQQTGENISDGSSQRNAGTGTREETGGLASRTEGNRSRWADQGRAITQREAAGKDLRKVSSNELGLQRGTDVANVKVMPQELWDPAMQKTADRVYRETDKQVTYVLGKIQIRGKDGQVSNVRGVITDDGVIIQANNISATIDQIADHEVYHYKAGEILSLNWQLRNFIMEKFSKEEFSAVLDKYIEAYRGIIDVTEPGDGESYETILRQIEEEIFADAYAGINAFGAHADKFSGAVNEWMDNNWVGWLNDTDNRTPDSTGPPMNERYNADDEQKQAQRNTADTNLSEHELQEGKMLADFVQEVNSMIDTAKRSKRKKKIGVVSDNHATLINRLMQTIKPGFTVDGYELWIDGTGAVHIEDRHGKNGKADQSMATKEAKMLIPWVSQNATTGNFIYDDEGNIKLSDRFFNSDHSKAPEIRLEKIVDGDTVYVSECVPDSTNKRIWITSAYIKKGSKGQLLNIEENTSPQPTPEATFDGNATDDIVTAPGGSVKDNAKEKYSVDPEQDGADDLSEEMLTAKKPETGTQTKVAQKALRKTLMQEFGIPEGKEEQLQEIIAQYTTEAKRKTPQRQKTPKVDKPVAKSQAVTAKNDLRKTVTNLFSIPEGQRAELGTVIDQYAERLLKNGELTEKDRQAFFDRLYASGVMTMPADDYFALGRSYIKDSRIYVNPSIRSEFGDDWSGFRRRAFGAGVYLTSDKNDVGVDVWNADMASVLPGLFDAEELDGRSALERIVQIAEEGRDEKTSLAEYTARLAETEGISEAEFLDNMERQLDWALRTFAEKAKLEIRLRDRTGIQIAKERARHKEMTDRQREQKQLRELQQKTLKQLQWLSRNQYRAPEELQGTFEEVLGDFDVFAVGAANELNWSDKYNATWRDLAQMYKDAKKSDPNFMPSKELERIVARLDTDKIANLDIGALQDLYKAAIGLRTEFYNRNNVINDEKRRLFAEIYTDAKGELEKAPEGYSGGKVDKFFNMEQLTPMNVLQRMAGWDPDSAFYSMARQLENGERDMRAYSVKAKRMLQEFLTEHENWVRIADGQGKNAIWYEIEVPELLELGMGDKPIFGDTVTVYMTPAQKVHLYLESKNVDNLRHMIGGRTFADKELYSKGKRQEAFAQGRTVRLAPETVKKLASDLTAEEMELAQVLEQYYNTFAKGEINRVSNVLYGYDKAMGKNYAPIYTNRNYVQSELGVFDDTAEGVGNLKGRIPHSKNPTYNIGAFDAFERHVDQTSRFVGMSIPARNWQTLLNWQEKGNSTGDVITHKWGEEGKKYITDLIETLQGGAKERKTSTTKLPEKIMSNYISAVFGANPSIVLKQLGSIPMASAYLGWRNMPNPDQVAHIDKDLIAKYSQDLAWRTMGYSMPETKQLKDNPNWTQRNKVVGFTFGGGAITAMDSWAASTLWPWAENKVRKEHPELDVGTQTQIDAGESPFYKMVAEEFENAMSRSQSVSDEIHQSSMRKDKSLVARAFTMFKSDSAQTYNTLRQKIGEAQFYARTGADRKTIKAAKSAAGSAVVAMLANAVWTEGVTLLMALWKNMGKKYRDDEDELTAESILKEAGIGIVGNLAGVVVFGEELADMIGNIITGEKWYGLETPGMEQLNEALEDIINAGKGMGEILGGAADIADEGGDVGEYFRQNAPDILGVVKNVAATAATHFAAIPVNNIEAYLLGILKWVAPELETAYQDAFAKAEKSGLSGLKGEALSERIGNIFDNRGLDTETGTADALAKLYEAGYTQSVPSDVPGKVTVNEESVELTEYQKQTYGKLWNGVVEDALGELVNAGTFRNSSPEMQEKMLKGLYDYAAEKVKGELFEEYEVKTYATVEADGVSLAEYIAWRTETSDMEQAEKMGRLAQLEMSTELKTQIVGTMIGTEMKTESGNPSQYAKFLSAMDTGMDVDEYLQFRNDGGDIDKYLDLQEAGVSKQQAMELCVDLEELEPLEGEDKVLTVQRWQAAVDSASDPKDQLAALSSMMKESQYEKVETAYSYGIKPQTYVHLEAIKADFDENGNGSYSQAEIKAAIDALDTGYENPLLALKGEAVTLTTKQKAVLWQLLTPTKSAKNNPYSVAYGQQVLDAAGD